MLARRLRTSAIVLLAALGVSAVFAQGALAYPTKTSPCSGCHGGANVPVTATLASSAGANATYDVSAPGADAVAVFSGTTRVAIITGPSGQFTVASGKTYTLYAVAGPSTSDGIGSTTVSPVAAPVDTTAPTTVSNAQSSYVSLAAITLSASDAGSGVAATYYKLDGAAQVSGTAVAVSALGSHTLEFWSVDVAGNAEAHKTVSFTITAPVPVDTTAPTTVSDAKTAYESSATIKLSATDAGSGVSATYFTVDGGGRVIGTTVVVTSLGSHTLQYWSVDVAGNVEAYKTATFTITAPLPPTPPADVAAPVTVSNATASYVGTATIVLTATDAGSGVAATYSKLDGGAQVTGTSVTVTSLGTHALEFWSVDAAGNVEAHHTASFTVTAVPAPGTTTSTLSIFSSEHRVRASRNVSLFGELKPGVGGESVQLYVKRPGATSWTLASTRVTRLREDGHDDDHESDDNHGLAAAKWSCSCRLTLKGTYQFQARFAGNASVGAATSRTISVVAR